MRKTLLFAGILTFCLLVIGAIVYRSTSVQIEQLSLLDPANPSIESRIAVELNKKSSIFIEYWPKGSKEHLQTAVSSGKKKHDMELSFLEPGTTYEYRVIIDQLMINRKSTVNTFKTIEQPQWLEYNWIRESDPHDEKALGNGLVIIANRKVPGSIMMVDGKGTVRWYWQADTMGVKLATLTPQRTVIALLGQPNSKTDKNVAESTKEKIRESKYPFRNGKEGFAGGYTLVEINLTGEELRRVSFKNRENPLILHHDVRVDNKGNIHAIYRDPLSYTMPGLDEEQLDTLWGDGVVEINKQGEVVNKWSAWKGWDIKNDPKLPEFAYDRFHFNSLYLDEEGNYLVSSPIENQIWKVNSKTGDVLWKLGENGSFDMDKEDYFAFQHDAHINARGNLMLFDNGDITPQDTSKTNKWSRTISFSLDTLNWRAEKRMDARLPKSKYTSRMGGADLLPKGNVLQTSSKTASVMVTDSTGTILWQLNMPFIPYRTEYISPEVWKGQRNL